MEARNNCCLELNGNTVGESQGWTDGLERLRVTVMGDGCFTAKKPTEIEGYLLQQMGLCTFSTVIHDRNRGTEVIVCYWTAKF